jgi:hypothetical protein
MLNNSSRDFSFQLYVIVKALTVSIKSCPNSKLKCWEKFYSDIWFLSVFWKKPLVDLLTMKINSTEAMPIRMPTTIVKMNDEKSLLFKPTIGFPAELYVS